MKKLKYNDKGYIIDTIYGKDIVRMCDGNIAKMKIYEWCYYKVFHWGFYSSALKLILQQLLAIGENLLYLAINLIGLVLSPLILIVMAHGEIKQAKEEVKNK